ncbi:MAG: tRNA (adenosine(37)-N6)-threonylcarbamoyltransferase complex ATPase subunit type 1 TsaE [Clostridia bacterium]|nr:tRNA (adenosine(37)-N6)-threonylcarbamoyltransferase complex ATPase subunit type 1 TsaE [Clostridia bacterium]
MPMVTRSPEETRRLGAALAASLQAGDVLLLLGDLGAGKSEFTRGIARGLGIGGPIASPSFTILNLYEEGRLPLCHFDWYRLSGAEELWDMGLEEYLGGDSVAVVEWPERCPEALPEDHLAVRITPLPDGSRDFRFTPMGRFRAIPGFTDEAPPPGDKPAPPVDTLCKD